MGVLSGEEIKKRLALEISDHASLVITPLFTPKSAFDLDSVDLRLGTHFLFPKVPPAPFFEPNRMNQSMGHFQVHVPLGSFLVVPAHQTVLGMTLEFIKLPYDLSGEILTKSSVARTFMVVETAPWIHPYYRGCLTLEIANVSNTPLLLYPGRAIGQLVLFEVLNPEKPRTIRSTYLGPVFPEAPKFKDPQEDLGRLGVKMSPRIHKFADEGERH
jgi:dCTP deaminase